MLEIDDRKEIPMNKVRVEGMHCNHCRLAVLEALNKLPGAKGVAVDLEHGMVTWEVIESTMEIITATIEDFGFDVVREDEPNDCCGEKDCGCGCC